VSPSGLECLPVSGPPYAVEDEGQQGKKPEQTVGCAAPQTALACVVALLPLSVILVMHAVFPPPHVVEDVQSV
jgi:hypothetical protein